MPRQNFESRFRIGSCQAANGVSEDTAAAVEHRLNGRLVVIDNYPARHMWV